MSGTDSFKPGDKVFGLAYGGAVSDITHSLLPLIY
jgi:hypothetical protein